MAGIDFAKLGGPSASDRELHPRAIFAALPSKSGRLEYLRDVQREVFDRWFEKRTKPDLVVKMNTGNGKTVVGLLMLKSSLNEGVRPAAYLTPDTYLADQVVATAADLGIVVSRDPRDSAVLHGEAVLVTTVHTLFNGRSKFGVGNEGRKIKLGAVLIDDAHACLTAVEQQFELTIPSANPVYGRILALTEASLRRQYPAGLLDLKAGDNTAALQVAPWDWFDLGTRVTEELHARRGDPEMEWAWPLIKNVIPLCRCVFTATEVQIKPPLPPVDEVPSFTQAQRRIYLTATLADDSVLVTHFGADEQSVRQPITPSSADDIGERMILIPQEVRPDWTEHALKEYLSDLAGRTNVVVIVPSAARAKWWGDVATATLSAANLEDGVADLKANKSGFTVLVAKYDGVDLPEDACRVLVIDGLPEAYSGMDRLESAALDDTWAMTGRQLQRIEQGMGRGIRSRDDHAVIILLGDKLVRRLHDVEAPNHFSPATRAQLALSREIASQLRGGAVEDFKAVVDQCLSRDIGWVTASRNALVGVKYGEGNVSDTARPERRAFDLAAQQRYQEAADAQQQAINAVRDDARVRGWMRQQKAAYLHPINPVAAQKLQVQALDDNRALLKPEQGIAYIPLKGKAAEQASTAAAFLSGKYKSPDDLLIGVNSVLADLIFDASPATVEPFEQALADLGEHLGLASQRPEKDFKKGPDVLWHLGGSEYAVIEIKNNVVTEFIRKHDVGQLSTSMSWFNSEYPQPLSAVPVMFHITNKPNRDAFPPHGTRVVTTKGLERMKSAVRAWAAALASDGTFHNPDQVGLQLMHHQLQGPKALMNFAISTVAVTN
ncbi:helicase C-terminal domain-containing protein [Arthrobacter sp. 1P04PC]|uniref:helicase C-terminal domain-containing protein n=1 Tax=unclassified Arthrobacter TaxID=235627 RepID=UPI0039A309DE